jgi:hypothetical protein
MSTNEFRHPLSRVLPSRPQGPMRVPARALGWFSIAIGLAELALPRKMARVAGAPDVPALTRACGLREIGTGIGILASKDPTPWLWGRVAGDALDVAAVSAGLITARRPMRTLTSVALVLGVAWLDMKVAEGAPAGKKRLRSVMRDYSNRSGFPHPVETMRGIAMRPGAERTASAETSPAFRDSRSALATAVAGTPS